MQYKKEWLDPHELEKELNIKVATQAKMRCEGKIPYVKFGGFVRYKRSEIEKWLKKHTIMECKDEKA